MNQKSLNCGIGITIVWLAVIFIFWWLGNLDSPKSLNELGDFLAGIFAPVAFLWLVLGYVQQGKQLEQNTKALEQQEKALQLQIDEMRESVKQQRQFNELQKQHFDGLIKTVEPILFFSKSYLHEYQKQICEYDEHGKSIDLIDIVNIGRVYTEIENLGKDARTLRIYCDDGVQYFLSDVIKEKSITEISFELNNIHYNSLVNYKKLSLNCHLEYENLYGVKIQKTCIINFHHTNGHYGIIFSI